MSFCFFNQYHQQKADDVFISWLKSKRECWSDKNTLPVLLPTKSMGEYNLRGEVKSGSSLTSSNSDKTKPITLKMVKEKVAGLINSFGVSNIEKTCKWFLLWNNR